jgi:NAD(P)-dependent dehydrogenase (short-subunit alcohol dehydrogenase family)
MNAVVLITGATRGIGFAAAEQLAARGALVIVASRDTSRAQAAAEKIGRNTSWLSLDINDPDSVNAAATSIAERHGRLDVLANNSAVLLDHYEGLDQLKPETLADTLKTNIVGTLRISQAMKDLLHKSPAPRIINVSSRAGQLDGEPQSWAPAYCISKTGLNMLTQQLTAAWPDIMVNSMCPGWCRTEMGGDNAPRSAEEGAETLTWLALDAPHSLRGSFIKDRQPIPW